MSKKNLYLLSFTEINGEREYSYVQLIAAKDIHQADRKADKYLRNFYPDTKTMEGDDGAYECCNGEIILRQDSLQETTRADFALISVREHAYDSNEDVSLWNWDKL